LEIKVPFFSASRISAASALARWARLRISMYSSESSLTLWRVGLLPFAPSIGCLGIVANANYSWPKLWAFPGSSGSAPWELFVEEPSFRRRGVAGLPNGGDHYSVRRNSGGQNLTDRAVDFVRQNFAERKVSRMVRFTPVLLSGSAYFGDS
jgi:hypothetical protein